MNATICSVVTISSLLLAHRLRIMAVSGIVVTGLGFQGLRQPCPPSDGYLVLRVQPDHLERTLRSTCHRVQLLWEKPKPAIAIVHHVDGRFLVLSRAHGRRHDIRQTRVCLMSHAHVILEASRIVRMRRRAPPRRLRARSTRLCRLRSAPRGR